MEMEALYKQYAPEVFQGYNITQQRYPEVFFAYDNFFGFQHPYPWALAAGSGLLYIVLVYIIWPLMRPLVRLTSPLFSAWRKIHNIFLFAYSGFCCFSCFKFMLDAGEFDFANKGFTPLLCNENMPHWLWVVNLTFVVSKAYEWLDTGFIVWFKKDDKGKGLSFLHVYHHATTFWLFLVVSNFTSTAKMGLLLNGFVHTLMYAHYAWPFPRAIVPLITIAQLFQLGFVTWVWSVTPFRCKYHSHFPDQYPLEFWTPYAMVPVYIIFFLHFFVNRFILGGGKKAKSKKE